jgi:hypothetical protein
MRVLVLFLLLLVISTAHSEVINTTRAKINYTINCQGCHLRDGSGMPDAIPRMTGYIGNFLKVPGGREFLVRVPGSANAPLNNNELAETLNWMLTTFDSVGTKNNFVPFTPEEVKQLRKNPLIDVVAARTELVTKIEGLRRGLKQAQ